MENYQALISMLGLTLGASWASGINLYAAILMLGVGSSQGWLVLPENLVVLQDPAVIVAAGFMYCVEFFADKTPGVDTLWDAIHSFIRIPAGALLAAGAVGELGLGSEIAAALVGGGVAATAHASKASARMLINTSPEPFSNWAASIGEDALVFSGLWLALEQPLVFVVLLLVFLGLAIWLLPKIWRLLGKAVRRIKSFFGQGGCPPDHPSSTEPCAKISDGAHAQKTQGASLVTGLERLQRLQAQGAITQAEYEVCKTQLLSGSGTDSSSTHS